MATVTERRAAFAGIAPHASVDNLARAIADAVNPALTQRPPTRGWTSRCVWFEGAHDLMAVVGPQEEQFTDLALAHGLYHCRGRRLTLVLPELWSSPTLRRLPWFTADVTVWQYGESHAPTPVALPSKEVVLGEAGDCETTPALHLEDQASEWLRGLAEWAAQHPLLEPAHRRDVRAWSCLGQRVLAISGRTRPRVVAGLDAKSKRALEQTVTGPLSDQLIADLKDAVRGGIANAQSKEFGAFAEHHLQQELRTSPHVLGLEHPVLREVPAWRPTGGPKPLGRGYIDLAGLDALGDLVLVETKLAADEMLVMQGLDYWIWAHVPANRGWLLQRLHADPARAQLRLLYAVGDKSGGTPVLSRYCRVHLAALEPDVDWRIAFLTSWNTDIHAEVFPRRIDPQ